MNIRMRHAAPILALVALPFVSAPVLAHDHSKPAAVTAPASAKTVATREALRDLWTGHVFWVRNVVTATLDGNAAAATAAENEVVANARQIAGAIEPFYGKAASDKLFTLLAGHYGAIKQYLNAAVAKDSQKQEAAWKALGANADEIAVFLSSANPNLPVDTVRALLLGHGGHHVQQIKQLQAGQYADEARTWADMTKHMNVIADALADALAKQFPKKFN